MPTRIGSRSSAQPLDDAPSASPSSAPPPLRSVSVVETAGERGAAPLPGSAEPAARLDPRLATLLTTDASRFDFFVTEGEAHQALEVLRGLSPADFHEAMSALQAAGLVDVLVDRLSWADQCQLLDVAARAGFVEREQGEKPTGPAEPPPHPDLYRESAKLPRALNDLIHEHSKASLAAYDVAYGAYLGRYNEAVGRCGSLQELRALGRPVAPTTTWELTDYRDPSARAYQEDWLHVSQSSPLAAYIAVADRMAELSGQRHDGAYWFEAKLESQISGVAVDVDVATGEPGRPAVKLNGGLAFPNLTGDTSVTAKAKADGTREVSAGTKLGDVGLSATVATDADGNVKKLSGTVDLVTVSSGEGSAQLTIAPVKVGSGQTKAEAGSYAALDRTKAELRGGVSVKGRAGPLLEGKLQVGFGMKGLSMATARRALGGDSVFDRRLPELERGAAWAELPAARQQALAALGWDETQWASALDALGAGR